MAQMARIRAGPAALRRAAGGNQSQPLRQLRPLAHPLSRLSVGALRTRGVATNAAVQEPNVDFPTGVPPVSVPSRSTGDERRKAIKNAKPFSDFLTDTFNRQHDYLRISITERCNLRCLYCMPEEGIPLSPSANMLTAPEIFYLSSLFVSQGVTKIRLTGGEPTVRRDIVPLMQQIGSLRPNGLRELALTTNGISLHRKLDAMVEAGLTGVNLSLDTLDPFQFQIMTRRKGFDAVMKSIDRILEMNKLGANVKLKVNCVVMRGLNEREIIPFVEMGREKDIEVRFIEYMPFGGNKWSENKMIGFQEMLDIIRAKYPDLRPVPGHKNDTSKTYEVPGFVGKVGFITSMTNDFCGTCNRLRITSDGNLKVCLHGNAEVSLRDVLRQGNNGEPIDQEAFERIKQIEMDRHEGRLSDETILGWGQRERELLDVVGAAVKRKAEKHADLNDLANMENRPMILIDGKPLSSLDSQWPLASRRSSDSLNAFLAQIPTHSTAFSHLHSISHPNTATVRAFSTSPASAAKKTYQLKRLAKAKKLLKAGVGTTDAFGTREFLDDVKTPHESERRLRDLEQKIADLHARLNEVMDQTPLASRPGTLQTPKPDAFDSAGLTDDTTSGESSELKRKGPRERKQAQKRAQSAFRQEKLEELGRLLNEHKEQLATVKEEVQKQADVQKRKEKLLAKKHALLRQLNEHEEEERRANLVRKTSRADPLDGYDLDDVLDDAVVKTRKMPVHPPREEREYKEKEWKDVEVPRVKRVVREPGKGAVSVLERKSGEEGLADPIMDRQMEGEGDADPSVSPQRSGRSDVSEATDKTENGEVVDRPAVGDGETSPFDNNAGDAFPPASPRPKSKNVSASTIGSNAGDVFPPANSQPRKVGKSISTSNFNVGDAFPPASPQHRKPLEPANPLKKDILHLPIPSSGFMPIDDSLIIAFDAPIPHLQSQVLALRDRLKSSYPRIDNLPYDVWTSNNKRTLQTWLKILISRWHARFDDVEATGQMKKDVLDERVKEVLDRMVSEHDLSNDAAERMAMRWHEVFDKRSHVRDDEEAVVEEALDWEEMEAGGMGFLGVEREDGALQEVEELPQHSERRPQQKGESPSISRTAGSGSTSNGVMGRRMYSTSARRMFWSWGSIEPKIRAMVGADQKVEVKHGVRVDAKTQTKDDARPDVRPDAKYDALVDAKKDKKNDAKPHVRVDAMKDTKNDAKNHTKPDAKHASQVDAKVHSKRSTENISPKTDVTDVRRDVKPEAKDSTKPDAKPIAKPTVVNASPKSNMTVNAKSKAKKDSKPDAETTAKPTVFSASPKPELTVDVISESKDHAKAVAEDTSEDATSRHSSTKLFTIRRVVLADTEQGGRPSVDPSARSPQPNAKAAPQHESSASTSIKVLKFPSELSKDPVSKHERDERGGEKGFEKTSTRDDEKQASGNRAAEKQQQPKQPKSKQENPKKEHPQSKETNKRGKQERTLQTEETLYKAIFTGASKVQTLEKPDTRKVDELISSLYPPPAVSKISRTDKPQQHEKKATEASPEDEARLTSLVSLLSKADTEEAEFTAARAAAGTELHQKRHRSPHPSPDRSDQSQQQRSPPHSPQPPSPYQKRTSYLPHLTSTGAAHMVSVSDKAITKRTAVAVGTVYFSNALPLQLIRSNSLQKGDVLATSRIAGIMAAKKCPDIIPLCHPIALTSVTVDLKPFGGEDSNSNANTTSPPSSTSSSSLFSPTSPSADPNSLVYGGILIKARVQCTGPTGVEMEALTAVMGTALSVIDMCKAVDKAQRIGDMRVVLKEGGKSGKVAEEGWVEWDG